MTNLLLRLFVKERDVSDPVFHSKVGRLAGFTGIVCNLLLTAGKLAAGFIAGSVAVIADAVNNLSDAASSIVTLIGFYLARRPADRDHPFGHARYEYLSATVTAALILMVGVELARASVRKILHPENVRISVLTMTVLILSVLVKLWLSVFYRKLGTMADSAALHASAVDSRNDVLATLAVLLGCVVRYVSGHNIDGCVGLMVSVFIFASGISLIRDTVSLLIGKRADKTLTDTIGGLITAHDKVLGIHDLLVHDYGPGHCYASVHVELDAEEDALSCHDILDAIEHEVEEKTHVHLVIHYDPVVVNDEEQNTMIRAMQQILHDLNPQYSLHDFRIVRGLNRPKLVFDLSVPYPLLGRRAQIQQQIDRALSEDGYNYVTTIRFDGK